jgi:AraC-like DNA-binding protein
MRPRNEAARTLLTAALSRRAAASASELAAQLGVSVPTLHRLLREQGDAIVATGAARRTRYALRRALRGDASPLPVYAVDAKGRADLVANLALVQPEGSCMSLDGTSWPVPEESRDGWWGGLPYPLYDMRPQGYLGRQLARAEHRHFNVAAKPEEWSDDDVVHILSRIGSDVSGNLIVGNAAFERWQGGTVASPQALSGKAAINRSYARLAEQAVAAGVPGSSAAGEFPKFPALRELPGSGTPHVLVKFSGADASPAVQRWSDLLVCEHLALECAATLPGVAGARSRIVMSEGRTFLEVERFDRHGEHGRSPLISLATLDGALLGDGSSDWARLAGRLAAAGWLGAEDVQRIEHLRWFGRLIANTDMHNGNLSFRPQGPPAVLALAPTYDMLPMLHAPLAGGEVPARSFDPPLPLPPQRAIWAAACTAAIAFWWRAATETRISESFRRVCSANGQRLEKVAQRV